ncbi:hypothetical protein C8N46_10696 [Kordia periserrulae]|uniref:Subunit length determinant protein n=1 Tax=Kordia periserrulae TaxID=701523 RepID=A0A2T6BWJ6_9FLAO|nr:hypothetical protein [Kordia periserrulae]PTX60452.1 hypothetical protein C8N46_10696 [Kordia periserrulae]
MSENIQNTENSKPEKSTEIDLGELFRMIGRGFSRFFAFLRNSLLILLDLLIRTLIVFREHVLKFVIIGILSITIGWFVDSRQPKVYGANMTVKLNYESEQQLYSNVQYYNSLIQESDSLRLSEIFEITPSQANQLLTVNIDPIITEVQSLRLYNAFMKETDSVNVADKITFDKFKNNISPSSAATHRIGVAALEKNVFNKLGDKIISLDLENDYVKTKKKVLYKTLEQEEEALKKRLEKIDTLRGVYNEAIRSEAKKTSQAQTQIQMSSTGIKTNEIELFTLDKEILGRLAEIEREKELNRNTVNVLSTFSEGIELRDFHDKYLYKIPLVTIALLLIFILLRELNKYLNTYAENKQLNA